MGKLYLFSLGVRISLLGQVRTESDNVQSWNGVYATSKSRKPGKLGGCKLYRQTNIIINEHEVAYNSENDWKEEYHKKCSALRIKRSRTSAVVYS